MHHPIFFIFVVLSVGAVVIDAKRVRAGGVKLGIHPGAVIKVKRSGFDALFDVIGNLGSKYARKCPIPDVTATVSGVDLEIKDLKIVDFQKLKISYTLVPPNQIDGRIEQPSVTVDGPFNATRRTFIKTQKDSGRLNLKFNDVVVSFKAFIGEYENGIPYIKEFRCESSLGPANMNLKNCKENFAKEVLGLAAKSIRPMYNSQVCSLAKSMVEKKLNKILGRFPNVLEFNENCALKYQVKPVVDSDSLQVSFYAKVLTEEVSSFQPAKFPDVPEDDAMVVIKISDAPFNDVCYQAFINNKLIFKIDPKSPKLLYGLLALRCEHEACLGNVAPRLAEKYGADAAVEAVIRATTPPQVEFTDGRAGFKASLAMDLTITPANDTSKPYHEATAAIEISGTLQVRIVNGVLYAQIKVEDVNVRIDEERNKKWENKITECIKKLVEDTINSGILLKGVPLKLPFGCGVTEPLIRFYKNALVAKTAFEVSALTSSEEEAAKKS